jgi:hypothetical protein
MSKTFYPQGASAAAVYADDSTDTGLELVPGDYGMPNALQIHNPDTANVVVVHTSTDSLDTNATVPTSGANGLGIVVGAGGTVTIGINSAVSQSLWVSVAGVSATGTVYITPGVLQ